MEPFSWWQNLIFSASLSVVLRQVQLDIRSALRNLRRRKQEWQWVPPKYRRVEPLGSPLLGERYVGNTGMDGVVLASNVYDSSGSSFGSNFWEGGK